MPSVAQPVAAHTQAIGIYRTHGQSDKSIKARQWEENLRVRIDEICTSAYWRNKVRFAEVRYQLEMTTSLESDWDTYGAESPNDSARSQASIILSALEAQLLPPSRLMPSAEGGIALSFVDGENRAEIEIYNTGEVVAATYSAQSEPDVWELNNTGAALETAIGAIRVHLAS